MPNDQGVVAVIDGQSLKITPFQTANIPPPMALHEISVDSSIADVALNANASLIAVLHQTGVSVFEWKSRTSSGQPPALTGRFTFVNSEPAQDVYQQLSFSDGSDIFLLKWTGSTSVTQRIGFNDETGKMEEVDHSELSSTSMLSTFSDNGLTHPFAQDALGKIHSLNSGGNSLSECKFPVALPWVEMTSIGDSHIAFGMSSSGHLYANSRLLVKNCTSFVITPAHLIFTTTAHLIKFVHITEVKSTFSSNIIEQTNSPKILKFPLMTQKRMRDAVA